MKEIGRYLWSRLVSQDQVFEVALDTQSAKVLQKKLDPEDDQDHDAADQRN